MSQATSPASGRAYGVARVARVWGVSRATLYRHRQTSPATPPWSDWPQAGRSPRRGDPRSRRSERC